MANIGNFEGKTTLKTLEVAGFINTDKLYKYSLNTSQFIIELR